MRKQLLFYYYNSNNIQVIYNIVKLISKFNKKLNLKQYKMFNVNNHSLRYNNYIYYLYNYTTTYLSTACLSILKVINTF